jgi:hypothetical protein
VNPPSAPVPVVVVTSAVSVVLSALAVLVVLTGGAP